MTVARPGFATPRPASVAAGDSSNLICIGSCPAICSVVTIRDARRAADDEKAPLEIVCPLRVRRFERLNSQTNMDEATSDREINNEPVAVPRG